MASVAQKILNRIHRNGRGWVFTPKDFLDLGARSNIDFVLHRLADAGTVQRLDRGLYYYPKSHPKIGVLTADGAQIAAAVARQYGDHIQPSGAKAANILGLSTQVPAQQVFTTHHTKKTIQVGKQIVQLVPTRIDADKKLSIVLQALNYLGRKYIDQGVIDTCAGFLSPQDKKRLRKQIPALPTAWLANAARQVAA